MREYTDAFGVRTLVCESPNELTIHGATIRPTDGEIVVAREFDDGVELSLSNGKRYLKYLVSKRLLELAADGPQSPIDVTMELMRRKLAAGEPPIP